MHDVRDEGRALVLRGFRELGRAELLEIAERARAARNVGREVVLDLRRVDHLHVGGAAALVPIPGLQILVRSRYVMDLLRAGGVLEVLDVREVADAS